MKDYIIQRTNARRSFPQEQSFKKRGATFRFSDRVPFAIHPRFLPQNIHRSSFAGAAFLHFGTEFGEFKKNEAE